MTRFRLTGPVAVRLTLAVILTLTALPVLARPAAAQITGPCTATAYQSRSDMTGPRDLKAAGAPSFDITHQDEWHVTKGAFLSGIGQAQSDQTFATVSVDAFGFGIPIVKATGRGIGGSAGSYAVDNWSKFTKSIDVTGESDSCSGSFEIIVDDQPASRTIAGAGGIAVGAFGIVGLAGVALRRRP